MRSSLAPLRVDEVDPARLLGELRSELVLGVLHVRLNLRDQRLGLQAVGSAELLGSLVPPKLQREELLQG